MTSKLLKLVAAAGAVAFTAWAGDAFALEGNSPFLPGVSTGSPVGALPPAGFYFGDTNVIINGGFRNNSGDTVPANVTAYLNIPSLLWVPGWNFLGATYAAAFVQPYTMQNLDFSGVSHGTAALGPAGSKSISQGLFNTIIAPAILSWNMHPFFFATGLTIYIDDGYSQSNNVGGGHKVNSLSSIANDFWTFEPNFAFSYLNNGLNLTANAVFDFNTKNNTTDYQSGSVFYLDLTAAQSFGKWTAGVGFNFTDQFTKDTGFNAAANGNELQKVLVGPLVGYNFGPVTLAGKALFGVETKNGAQANFYYIGTSFPF